MLLVALAVFDALADELAEWRFFVSLDSRVDAILNERATPWVTSAMEFVSWWGSTPVLVLVTVLAAGVLLARRHVRAAVLVGLAFVGAALLASALKVEFERPRPSVAHPLGLQAGGYSFPSGHATGSLAVYGTLGYLAVASGLRASVRAAGAIAALVLVAAIGFSRVYLGKHFPSDVIAGWCVALVWVGALVLALSARLPGAT